jgi:hypothetical protein
MLSVNQGTKLEMSGAYPVTHQKKIKSNHECNAHLLAKPRIRRGWDLVSRICHIETHRMAARNPGALLVSELALLLCTVHVQ